MGFISLSSLSVSRKHVLHLELFSGLTSQLKEETPLIEAMYNHTQFLLSQLEAWTTVKYSTWWGFQAFNSLFCISAVVQLFLHKLERLKRKKEGIFYWNPSYLPPSNFLISFLPAPQLESQNWMSNESAKKHIKSYTNMCK